jgi:hypothetical protein
MNKSMSLNIKLLIKTLSSNILRKVSLSMNFLLHLFTKAPREEAIIMHISDLLRMESGINLMIVQSPLLLLTQLNELSVKNTVKPPAIS